MSASILHPAEGTHGKEVEPDSADLTEAFFLGDWRIEPSSRCAYNGATEVKIDPRNFRVLQALADRQGQIVSQREIELLAWEGVVVTSNSLHQSIRQLRQAFGDSKPPAPAKYIETVPRRGYRLVAEVKRVGSARGAFDTLHDRARIRVSKTSAFRNIWIASCLLSTMVASVGALLLHRAAKTESEQPVQIDAHVIKDVQTLRALSLMKREAGKAQESLLYLGHALQQQLTRTGERNQTVVDVLSEIANTHFFLGNDAVALATAKKARSLLNEVAPPSSPERISSLSIFAEIFVGVGEYAEAEDCIGVAVTLARNQYGNRHPSVLQPLWILATLRHAQGNLIEAESISREVLRIAVAAWGANDFRVAHHGVQLSFILTDMGRFAEAEREARISVAVLQLSRSHDHPYLLSAKHALAEALVKLGRDKEAEMLLTEEIPALKRESAADWRIGRAASVLAEAYLNRGEVQAAEKSLSLAESKLARAKGWPAERELRNLQKRRAALAAVRVARVPDKQMTKALVRE